MEATLELVLAFTEEYLFRSSAAEGVIARHEAGRPRTGDAALAAGLAAALRADQAPDGSWRRDLVCTAESLLLLAELAPEATDDRSAAAAVDWLRARRGSPGRWGDPCTPVLHDAGLCAHAAAGFFAPAPPERQLASARLACGAHVPGDADARFAASALALRALLRWGERGADARLHLDALRRALGGWQRWTHEVVGAPALLVGAATLLEAPAELRAQADEALLSAVLALVGRGQRGDGSWPETDMFQVLDTLVRGARRGFDTRILAAALPRCAPMLALWQQSVGAFAQKTESRRSLVVWRALRTASRPGRASRR